MGSHPAPAEGAAWPADGGERGERGDPGSQLLRECPPLRPDRQRPGGGGLPAQP